MSTDTILGWLAAATVPNAALVAALASLAFSVAASLLLLRRARRRYRTLDGLHRTLVGRYYEALSRSGGGALVLVSPDAGEQAQALREYADQVRSLSDGRDPFDTAHVVARGMEDIADELDPEVEEEEEIEGEDDTGDEDAGEEEEATGQPVVAQNGASKGERGGVKR